jgi:hypothetical protein
MGKQSLKIGGDVFYYQAYSLFDSNLRGSAFFSDVTSFQRGIPLQWTQTFGNSNRHNVSKDFFWFGQDDIRLTNTFTLNLGVRVERSGGVKEKQDLLSNINLSKTQALGALGTGAMGGIDIGGNAFQSNLNWAPRVGFSWNPMGGKMVMRAGYGWAYDYIFLNPITNLRFSPPIMPSITVTSFTGGNTLAAFVAGTAPAQLAAIASIGVFPATQVNFGNFSPVDQHLKNPRNQQWNFGLQYEVLKDTVLKVSYVGSKTDFLQASVPINLINPAVLPAPAASEAAEIAGRATLYSPAFVGLSGSATRASNRIDPRFNNVTQVKSIATSNYNSLQIDLLKHMAHGLSFAANYTWAHGIDNASDALGVLINDSAGWQDPRDITTNRANSQFDIRHRLVGNFVWEVPWLRNLHGPVGKVIGGWGFSSVIEYHTGFPVTIFGGTRRGINDPTLLSGTIGVLRANGDPTLFHAATPTNTAAIAAIPGSTGTAAQKAAGLCTRGIVTAADSSSCPNTSGFPLTQAFLGNFGSSPRNALRLDKLFNADMAIFKNTGITERVKTQFRLELFNAFNSVNFGSFVNTLTSTAFGQYQGTATNMRQMQASIKVLF